MILKDDKYVNKKESLEEGGRLGYDRLPTSKNTGRPPLGRGRLREPP